MAPVLEAYKDIVGYWGPVDALHTFCEPKYVTHPKAAEFYNSIGSLIYCVAALAGLRATSGMVWQVTVGWWSILIVGIGSTLFHLTMRYHMELLDELPMLLLIACAILGFHGAHPYASTPRRATLFLCATVGFLGVFTAIYLYTRIFGLFITMFTIEIAAVIGLGVTSQTKDRTVSWCRNTAIAWIVVARVFWETEVHACRLAPWVWPLHNVWHVTSCIAAYYMLFHMYYYRVERLGLEGAYGARRSFPSLPKPLTFNAAWHRELEERALARLAKDLGGAQSGAAK